MFIISAAPKEAKRNTPAAHVCPPFEAAAGMGQFVKQLVKHPVCARP